MKEMDLNKDTYNRIAEDWHKDHLNDEWWTLGTDRFIELLGPGARVLDVGCAGGVKSEYLRAHRLDVVGIDLSEKMIDIARREYPGIEFHAMDLSEAWRLPDMFDGIFMQAVLLHVPKKDAHARIESLAKNLKDGGYFYIAVKAMRADGIGEEVKTENDYGYEYQRFFSYYSSEEIQKYFEELGFKIVHEELESGKETPSLWIQIIAQKS